jgi:glutamate transport system permease protein
LVAGWLSRRTRRSGRAPRANTGPAILAGAEPGLGGGGGMV